MILGSHASVVDQMMDRKVIGLKILPKLINTCVFGYIKGNGLWLICIFENFIEFRSRGWVPASRQNSKPFLAKDLHKAQPDPSVGSSDKNSFRHVHFELDTK